MPRQLSSLTTSFALWQDIVRWPTSTEWLVFAYGVESRGPNELAVVGDDAYVCAGDQDEICPDKYPERS